MSESETTIPCPACDADNDIALDETATSARCRACDSPLFTGKPLELTSTKFNAHALAKGLPIVIDFWAEWCGPCQTMGPIFETLTAEFEPKVRFAKVNTDAERPLAEYFRIQSIPTISVIRDQRELGRIAGLQSTSDLRHWLFTTLSK